jgi:glutamate-ammonia-ligase adenylyltransferase
LGFADPTRSAVLVADFEPQFLDALAVAADPDLALRGVIRLLEASADPAQLRATLARRPLLTGRLVHVLGASAALSDHLVRHPDDWRLLDTESPLERRAAADLRSDLLRAVGATPEQEPVAAGSDEATLDALRIAYRRHLLVIAARDLAEGAPVDEVAAELADLAAAALEAGLAIARTELRPDDVPVRLAVIAMGKAGARELNYVSDVDVVYVAEPAVVGVADEAAQRTGARLAAGLARACSTRTAEGSLWEVDAALRPEGKAGPLTRSLRSHLTYYGRWAKTWEFQALLKARPVAGDLALGEEYVEAVLPLVWQAASREGFVEDVQAMRRRVEQTVAAKEVDRQLKLGPGGLRDVEFAVQLLQLVHGRSDETLRQRATLDALAALSTGGYVGREDAAALDAAYRFLRTLEHRLQLYRLLRTHVMPTDDVDLRRLGRSVGLRTDPVAELTQEWRRHSREVRRLHEKLFYRPLLQAVARLGTDDTRLTADAARARLEALGYRDPVGALRHLEALTSGVSRRAAIQRTLLPVMLGWFADGADPDGGLLGFRQVSDALGTTHWYLALLRDAGASAERLARVLASSRFATDLLLRAPECVAMLASDDDLRPRAKSDLVAEMLAAVGRAESAEAAAVAVRGIRRRELFRIAVADIVRLLDVVAVGAALTVVADAAVEAALAAATTSVALQRDVSVTRVAVIGMGRFGGGELSYGSDVDVLFVHDPQPGVTDRDATDVASSIANELRRLLSLPAPDPPLVVDADLRPEGRNGPLVRSLASYAAYYERWSLVWESQALLRARPVAGDAELAAAFVTLIDPLRWPAALDDADAREIRRIKARVEAERLPRGADPATHTKLGRGGLADVEWTVQLLQLQHAGHTPTLRTTATLPALDAARDAALLDSGDSATLAAAWRLATRVRNGIVLVRGRADDSLPRNARELAGVAALVGYAPGDSGALSEDYRRITRRARSVVERVFYG